MGRQLLGRWRLSSCVSVLFWNSAGLSIIGGGFRGSATALVPPPDQGVGQEVERPSHVAEEYGTADDSHAWLGEDSPERGHDECPVLAQVRQHETHHHLGNKYKHNR